MTSASAPETPEATSTIATTGAPRLPGPRAEAVPEPPGLPPNRPPTAAWWSRGLVALVAVLVAAVVGIHLAATFVYNAPPSPVSQKFAGPLRDWMTPLFTQNWQLFAPNPLSEGIDVQARASIAGSGQVTAWHDLSAVDEQATLHNPAPTQITLNGLRNAVLEWLATHDSSGNPTGANAGVAQQYLSNVVVQRLTAEIGGKYSSVQVRFVFTLLPGPGRTAAQTKPQARTLTWWVL